MRAPLGRLLAIAIATLAIASLVGPRQAFADPTAAPLPSRDFRSSMTSAATLDTGSLPSTTPGISLGLGFRRGGLGARGVVSVFRPTDDGASGARITLVDAVTLICVLGPIGNTFDIGACGGGGVGHLSATLGNASDSALRPQFVAIPRFDIILSPALLISAEAGVLMDPLRTSLQVSGPGEPFRASLFAFRASLGVHVRFW